MADVVTLDDVARAAGVSRAAASRALNGRPGVRDDVRERVAQAAKSLDYRRNRAAANLAGGSASVIGLVLGTDRLHDDPYATSLVESVARAAASRDHGLMLLMKEPNQTTSTRNMVRDGLVDGVIISSVVVGEPWIEDLLASNVPSVLVGAHPERPEIYSVDVENLESAAALVGHLLDSGCSRIATITGTLGRVDASLRLAGYRTAHEQRGLTVDESLVFVGNFRRGVGYDIADDVLGAAPDAVFAANDEMAIGFIDRARERSVDIPGDIAVVGFDGSSMHQHLGFTITSIIQPFDVLAETVVDVLVSQLAGGEAPTTTMVPPTLLKGDTTIWEIG